MKEIVLQIKTCQLMNIQIKLNLKIKHKNITEYSIKNGNEPYFF